MLMPKRTKYRRPHRVSYEGVAKGRNEVINGDFALQALQGSYITSQQIEAARIAMTRHMKRLGQVWINIFPHMSRTKKPLEVRMGSGKGTVEYWVSVVKPGRVMFEIGGVSETDAKEALRLATHKLPCKCKIVSKADLEGGVSK